MHIDVREARNQFKLFTILKKPDVSIVQCTKKGQNNLMNINKYLYQSVNTQFNLNFLYKCHVDRPQINWYNYIFVHMCS